MTATDRANGAPRLTQVESLAEIAPGEWDALAGDQPFVSHAFLSLLESTGCVGRAAGWRPAHLLMREGGTLVGALPAYLKNHSWGEFVFDFGWAQAYQRAGLAYYPKLVVAVPFTPATGPRLLLRPDASATQRAALVAGVEDHVRRAGLSSAHALFVDDADRRAFADAGWLLRRDCQFHWSNRGYRTYDDYLATFTAEKRKKAKRERRRCEEAGITFRTLHGDELDAATIDDCYALHRDTFVRHGHDPYLTRAFFRAAAPAFGRRLMVKLAVHEGHNVAAAIFFRSGTTLYGRYWGAREDFHSLHFEACYHQGIDYCIEQQLQRFEPGTQGEHKVSRGFEPTLTWSAHHIADPRFRAAIDDFLEREAPAVTAYAEEIDRHTPFRRDAPT